MTKLLINALQRENDQRPPVWFMRQAGRYHQHYQQLRKGHDFVQLCKDPALACEVTMGPIRDFDYDAAILFSDILFPLEVMGIPLAFQPGPQLGTLLRTKSDVEQLNGDPTNSSQLMFQYEALRLIRQELPAEKGLIGFVGSPLTLFYFATVGSHKHSLELARSGLVDGRYELFCEKVLDLLIENMSLQARAGVDQMAMFDTCAGDLSPDQYAAHALPALSYVMKRFKDRHPKVPLLYYSKLTNEEHWNHLIDLPIDCLGIDWNHDLVRVLDRYSDRWAIQGNFDPHVLRDSTAAEFSAKLEYYFKRIKELPPRKLRGWVCGLGHGVLPMTPEDNVRSFIKMQREVFHG